MNAMFRVSRRTFTSLPRHSLNVSNEIREALATKSHPVVSLESTIITHGLPYPRNLEMALQVEQTVRDHGAIPATCAFIKGVPHVGVDDNQLEQLAKAAAHGTNILKVSRRDIGYTMANGMDGGTTIALTMILSHMAGIKVFATGGLGGVHKDGHRTFDISADLTELGKTPVAVVCAGPKSILDVGLTMEYLETQGVFVGTFNDDGRKNIQVPGFYCRELGVKSPYSITDVAMAASVIHNQTNVMKLNTGSVFCVPPPRDSALSSLFINEIISKANDDAVRHGVSGKELTPYLLGRIANETQGRSVECNIEFVLNNAKCAAQIATHLLKMEQEIESHSSVATHQPVLPSSALPVTSSKSSDKADVVVIGLVAVDTISKVMETEMVMGDLNPGSIRSSIGGVGFNLNLACDYGFEAGEATSKSAPRRTRLVSVVGDDLAGKTVMEECGSLGLDRSGIAVQNKYATAQYACIHAAGGELVVACADMTVVETDFTQHAIEQLNRAQPQVVILDCNLSLLVIQKILQHARVMTVSPQVIIEPTSVAKATRLGQVETGVFPENAVSLITPTVSELSAIFKSFGRQEKFDDLDQWFPVIDSLGINSGFRDKCELIAKRSKSSIIKRLFDQGTLQECFHLLPYFPNILVKLGTEGLIMVSITKSAADYKSIPTTSPFKPQFSVTSLGKSLDSDTQMGVLVQYFPIPQETKDLAITNVTGAGDSLLGYLASRISANKEQWLDAELVLVEQEWRKWQDIYESQLAAGCSLQCELAVSPEIKLLGGQAIR